MRFSSRAFGVGVGVIGAYVAAAEFHYPEFAIVAAAGAFALVVGLMWVLRSPRLEVDRLIEPTRVTRGDVAFGRLSVRNLGRVTAPATLATETFGKKRLVVDVPRLEPGAGSRTTYRLPTDRRAIIEVGPLFVGRHDPFGLWTNAKKVGTVERLWVHPVTHRLAGIPVGKTRSIDGRDAEQIPQGSITFHALREYVRGDDLRHVHWRSSARVGSLMVKERVDTALPQVTVILDTSRASSDEVGFEEMVEITASVTSAVTGTGFPVRLVTTGGHSVAGRGISADSMELLDFLSGVGQEDDGNLGATVTSMVRKGRGDMLVAITGHPDAADLVDLAALASRFDRVVVGIVGAEDQGPEMPIPANLRLLRAHDARSFAQRWNGTFLR